MTALLALEDGTCFKGELIGHSGNVVGEVVFNTSMMGYQEILTDPSYAQQIITFTAPHIGNVGCNADDEESNKIWAHGLIIRELSSITSNWRSEISLDQYLKKHKITGIANIDTRQLTNLLREKGAQQGCITTDINHPKLAIQKAKQSQKLINLDLAKIVSTQKIYQFSQNNSNKKYNIIAYDFGVKRQILNLLAERDCNITVVPAQTSAEEVLKLNPDGIFLSNGPGDPAPCDYAIKAIQIFLAKNIPIFGICLGCQLLALACGAKTEKMKTGHHGANHPVLDIDANTVAITSQNHGFMINESSLPKELEITHRSLFDNSIEGIRHKEKPAMAFQAHPEASPGPQDSYILFDQFIEMLR